MRQEDIGRTVDRMAQASLTEEVRGAPLGVTIIIPNWNHEYVLPRSVITALRTVKVFAEHDVPAEVLVVDDSSRDGSITLLRQLEALYYEDGFRAIILPKNQGPAVARNYAITQATYRYTLMLDADNEVFPETAHIFYRTIRETEAAMVYGPLCFLRNGEVQEIYGYQSIDNRLFIRNYIDAFTLLDRQQVADVHGYLNNINVYAREDWELILRLTVTGRRIVFLPVILGLYHMLPDSMILGADAEDNVSNNYANRVYNQLGFRGDQPINTQYLRYHPDIGYF